MKEIRLVIWTDSYGATGGWSDVENFTPQSLLVKSIGFVIYEDDKLISLSGSYAEETDNTLEQANGIITIPKCCIKHSICLSSCQELVSAQKPRPT